MSDLANWKPRPLPSRVALEGRYARLEPLSPARHGETLYQASIAPGAEDRFRYLFESPPASRAEFDSWLAKASASSDPMHFAVIDKAAGTAEGRQTLMRIDPNFGVIEIGNILWGPKISQSRVATEAQFLFALYAFETLGYRRYEWKCNNENEPSKRAAARFGFSPEGLFRQHMVVKGRNRDTAWFAMIDAEWPRIKRAYERWLDPKNFSADGRQKLSLSALNLPELTIGPAVLRRAGAGDRAALERFQGEAYATNRKLLGVEPVPLQWNYADVLANWEVWLAPGKDGLKGALLLNPREKDLMLESVSTAPGAQGTGLGNTLLEAAEYRARDWGCDTIRLYTGEKLVRNVEWYKRKGYVVEFIEDMKDRRAVHMMKTLR